MIQAVIRNNAEGTRTLVSETSTLREAFEQADIDYSTGTVSLDGATISPGDLDKTFAELGYDGSERHDRCFLCVVAKLNNA